MKIVYLLLLILLNSVIHPQIKEINPDLYSTWLRYEFYKDIESGKTPRESMRMEFMMQIYFFEESNEVLFGSFNEGVIADYFIINEYSVEVYNKPGIYGNGFIASLIRENDETFLLIDYEKEKILFKKLDKKYYHRDGVQYFVNDRFITGKYISSADSTNKIEFYTDGRVEGIKNYFKYDIPLFGFELPLDFNTIIMRYLQNSQREIDVYHWKRTGDTLILYNLKLASDNPDDPTRYIYSQIADKYLELIKID